MRVHGWESVREPTTVTLAGQGLHTQVPSYTACTCLRESRSGWSRAAGGSLTPSKGSPVMYSTFDWRFWSALAVSIDCPRPLPAIRAEGAGRGPFSIGLGAYEASGQQNDQGHILS